MQYNLPATMKMSTSVIKSLFLTFAIAILGLAPGLRAQNITATIGSVNSSTCAVGDTLVIPVIQPIPQCPLQCQHAQAVQGRLVCFDAGYRERYHVQSAIQGFGNRKFLG